MAKRIGLHRMLLLAMLAFSGMLGGCIAYPAYPNHGYSHGGSYDRGGYMGYGGGWHEGGRHEGDWRR